ncbi:hypothetical protein [Sphingomonas psychrotolerans]|uniref:Uncharacterized protein n=1 Tax=Sphingomonas psychrotolerans TaxID=1327635 RepID=A0A2K8MA55_9SPHN|nr:hypothetical protein [Sphingomonas psychrotolerans]ATY30760.1 hypothetical protein CVN68_01090 [Sphingomonas psychrotolerans]
MIRLSLAATTLALASPVAAQAQTELSPTDQARTVCAPKRDKAGNKIGGEICMTGKQWQVALAKVRWPAKYQRPARTTQTGHFLMARPTRFY